jgi:hypothetical protein
MSTYVLLSSASTFAEKLSLGSSTAFYQGASQEIFIFKAYITSENVSAQHPVRTTTLATLKTNLWKLKLDTEFPKFLTEISTSCTLISSPINNPNMQ